MLQPISPKVQKDHRPEEAFCHKEGVAGSGQRALAQTFFGRGGL